MQQRILVTGLACLALLASSAAMAAAALPLEHFTRFADFGSVKISPDGQYLAATTDSNGGSSLVFLNLQDKKLGAGIRTPDTMEILDFEWVSDTRVVYTLAERFPGYKKPVPTGEIFAIDRDGSRKAVLYGYRAGQMSTGTQIPVREASYATPVIISTLKDDDKNILIAEYSWEQSDPRPRITRLNVYNGQKKSLGTAPLAAAKIVVDQQEQVRFAVGYNEKSDLAVIWKTEPGANWQSFELPGFRDQTVRPLRFTADNRELLFAAVREGESLYGLYSLDLASRQAVKLYQHEWADLDGIVPSVSDGSTIGVAVNADKLEYHWLAENAPTAMLYKSLQLAFPGQTVQLSNTTRDGKRVVVFVSSDINPGQYFLFDTQARKAEFLLAARSWINPKLMRPKEIVSFKARDGVVLRGYLTRPAEPGPAALVVLPHGGPHGVRDDWDFDAEVQLLANRGYAVLQVNYRGSDGYGVDFETSGYRQWGARMQDDLTDATRWAVTSGAAREGMTCIYGASYGGYAALMGAAREPSLYRCAVGYVGVYDLELMFTSGDIPETRRGRSYLDMVLGNDSQDLRARSPVHNAARITVPVMLIHGKEDQRADFQQAKRMRKALEDAGKPPVWLAMSGEGHGAYDERNRVEVYTQLLAFLQQHLPTR